MKDNTSKEALPRIPVLLYHRIDSESDPKLRRHCVAPEAFAQQLAWLAQEGYATISLSRLQRHYCHGEALPDRPIVITFDDGYCCNYTRAFPMLRAHGYAATIFLAVDLMRKNIPATESREAFMSWEEIREMRRAGFSFQAHGCSHRPLDTISLGEVAQEARESKARIEKELKTEVKYFCYPFSRYNEQIKQVIKREGYAGACGGPPFWEGGPRDWYEIGRTEILWSDSMAQFRFKIKNGLGHYYFTKRQLGKIKKKFLAANPALW